MKKVVKLTESDIQRIVKRVINEQHPKMGHGKKNPKSIEELQNRIHDIEQEKKRARQYSDNEDYVKSLDTQLSQLEDKLKQLEDN
jgi:polyhydroxyalkanoate synthesis regulator phasin